MQPIGITERGDAALSTKWKEWVRLRNPAILITKNPSLLFDHLCKFPFTPNVIIHATITGHGGGKFEPGAPKTEAALSGYKELIRLLGKERVVLRVDPIFPSSKGAEKALEVINQCLDTRIRISFLDAYPHVVQRFKDKGLTPPPYNFHAPLKQRKEILATLTSQTGSLIEVCGEPRISCNGCISSLDIKTFGLKIDDTRIGKQRKDCKCLAIKKELLTTKGQCKHNCIYCYWH